MAKFLSKWNVKIGDTTPPPAPGSDTFTNSVENLTSVDGPGGESPQVDITDNDSTAREFAAGLIDYGTIEFEGNRNYGAAGQELLRTLQASGSARNFQLEFLDPSDSSVEETFDVVAVVTAFRTQGSVDGAQTFSCTIKTSGAGTFS